MAKMDDSVVLMDDMVVLMGHQTTDDVPTTKVEIQR